MFKKQSKFTSWLWVNRVKCAVYDFLRHVSSEGSFYSPLKYIHMHIWTTTNTSFPFFSLVRYVSRFFSLFILFFSLLCLFKICSLSLNYIQHYVNKSINDHIFCFLIYTPVSSKLRVHFCFSYVNTKSHDNK